MPDQAGGSSPGASVKSMLAGIIADAAGAPAAGAARAQLPAGTLPGC
jgi:hypothetical protein